MLTKKIVFLWSTTFQSTEKREHTHLFSLEFLFNPSLLSSVLASNFKIVLTAYQTLTLPYRQSEHQLVILIQTTCKWAYIHISICYVVPLGDKCCGGQGSLWLVCGYAAPCTGLCSALFIMTRTKCCQYWLLPTTTWLISVLYILEAISTKKHLN